MYNLISLAMSSITAFAESGLRYPLSWKNEIKLFPVSDYVEFFSELHIQNENHCYFSFLFDPSWNMWL